MFAPVLQSQAVKTIPLIDETKEKIKQYLLNSISTQTLEENLETIQKALECRKSDIEKAEDTGKEYFIKLVGNIQDAKKDNELIENALVKIKHYLE